MGAPAVPTFSQVRLREGYDIAEVDAFIVEMLPWLEGHRAEPAIATRITEARFTPVRVKRGYDMGEVDEFLDVVLKKANGPSI